jgi:hypothetical protein
LTHPHVTAAQRRSRRQREHDGDRPSSPDSGPESPHFVLAKRSDIGDCPLCSVEPALFLSQELAKGLIVSDRIDLPLEPAEQFPHLREAGVHLFSGLPLGPKRIQGV